MSDRMRHGAPAAVRRSSNLFDLVLVALTVALAWALAPAPRADRSAPSNAADQATLQAAIARLPITTPAAERPYDRAEFPHWVGVTPGCDTRCAVLDRQRTPGGWWSAYDGYVATSPTELEIDHVVPLAEAWVSGAWAWTLAQRRAYANELTGAELLAVSSWSNRAKGAHDPATWRPPDRTWWCAYAQAWVTVKLRWHLTADAAEVHALQSMARTC